MIKKMVVLTGPLLISVLVSCGGGDGGTPPVEDEITSPIVVTTACINTAQDSPPGLRADRIRSYSVGEPVYHSIASVRIDATGNPFSIDYMVHPATGAAKALLVLVQGGNGDAKITSLGESIVQHAGGNFLVRSAHLFAAQGYKVVTIDQPSDYIPETKNSDYNFYRASVDHAVDLSTIINVENDTGLPVILAGTSRGAISAVAQHKLADAIALSSPVTNDIREFAAVNEASATAILRPSSVGVPTHVMWHVDDACSVSPVIGSETLVADFNPDAANNLISGGFDADDKVTDCKGHTVHGFYGIETCAVGLSTAWMDGLSLPTSKPKAGPVNLSYNISMATDGIDIADHVTSSESGALTFSLPFSTTTLGGTITIDGTVIKYIKPDGPCLVDSFVYRVQEDGGGMSHNVVTIGTACG